MQALIDELEFNADVATRTTPDRLGCLFSDKQFHKAISLGSIATLQDTLKRLVIEAYVAIGRANQHITGAVGQTGKSDPLQETLHRASGSIAACSEPIKKAHTALLEFLGSEK